MCCTKMNRIDGNENLLFYAQNVCIDMKKEKKKKQPKNHCGCEKYFVMCERISNSRYPNKNVIEHDSTGPRRQDRLLECFLKLPHLKELSNVHSMFIPRQSFHDTLFLYFTLAILSCFLFLSLSISPTHQQCETNNDFIALLWDAKIIPIAWTPAIAHNIQRIKRKQP